MTDQEAIPQSAVPLDPSAQQQDAQPRPKVPLWTKLTIGLATIVIIASIAGFVIHVPYSTISPGDAVPLTKLVRVDGARTYQNQRGDIRLLFVRERNHVNLWRYLLAQFDPDTDVLKEEVLNPSGAPQPNLNAEAESDMTTAKLSATKVALEAAGYKVSDAKGILVTGVLPSGPAAKLLKPGDVILAANGTPVNDNVALHKVISRLKVGEKVTLEVLRDGRSMSVPVAIAQGIKTSQGPITGVGIDVFPHYSFPVTVTVNTAGIGGPSGGLAMTLAILDAITPGNLTGGARVAVTGTIDPNGNVGEIGGIEQKAVAARAAHAKLFIVPQCSPQDPPAYKTACEKDLARATKRVGSSVKVIPVATFEQALDALRANGGQAVTPSARAA